MSTSLGIANHDKNLWATANHERVNERLCVSLPHVVGRCGCRGVDWTNSQIPAGGVILAHTLSYKVNAAVSGSLLLAEI